MARFMKGDVMVIPFPFSDLIQSKRRPALIVTSLEGDDIILYGAGSIKFEKLSQVIDKIIEIIRQP